MAVRNVLVEGVSGAGKTSVCRELQRRGFSAVNGDTDLAFQGDPLTGEPLPGVAHEHHIWRLDAVRALVADRTEPALFLCGGSRNTDRFLHLIDVVIVLVVDRATLERRLVRRPPDEFGGTPEQRELVLRMHRTGEGMPTGIPVDATAPLPAVVDEVLRVSGVEPIPGPRRAER